MGLLAGNCGSAKITTTGCMGQKVTDDFLQSYVTLLLFLHDDMHMLLI
jgi:hypothetical protein